MRLQATRLIKIHRMGPKVSKGFKSFRIQEAFLAMKMLANITFNLQCLRISSDLKMLSSELGLLKRPT